MVRAALDDSQKMQVDAPASHHFQRWLLPVTLVILLLGIGVSVYLVRNWPFTEKNVVKQLQQATSSTVHISAFERVFFPRPGCIAQGVSFEKGSDPHDQVKLTVDKLIIEGTLTGLFSKHLASIRLLGAHAFFPEFGTGPQWKPTTSDVVVDELIANSSLLEFARRDPKGPKVQFAIDEFLAHHLATHDPMKFELRLHNPTPPGEVRATGTFGPWNMDSVSATPVAGNYSFSNADLGAFEGIHGILGSNGQFHGTIENIEVNGATTTPDFQVKGSTHQIPLETNFEAMVDSKNGDVTLQQVQARVLRTIVVSHGSVAGRPGEHGKITSLDMSVRGGRIQDLLLLFVSEKHSPLSGVVSLKAKTVVPPGDRPFLRKLRMEGDFGIDSALFTKEETQGKLEKLSEAARGQADQTDDPDSVVSDLQGHVVVRDGIATFTNIRFLVPGAQAHMEGTFDLITQKVNLRGLLLMDANLPKATTGIKSFLLKAVDPFLKKNRHGGARIPVSITGTYQHPSYHADPV